MKYLLLLSLVATGFGQVLTDEGIMRTFPAPNDVRGVGNSLTTIFAADNSFAGNTFDVEVTSPINITGFDVNLDSVGTTNTITIYYRIGTAVGNENTPGAWTMIASDPAVISAGDNNPSSVQFPGLVLEPGTTYGFYVDLESYPSASMLYTNGGPNVYSNADISITTNTGQASPAFSGSFTPRQWNGTIYYEPAIQIPTMSTWGLIIFSVLLAGGVVYFRRKQRTA